MKRVFLILSLVMVNITFVNWRKSYVEVPSSQGINIEGTWSITAMAQITRQGTKDVMAKKIKNGEAVNDFFFMQDGKFKQTSNMSGSGTMDTYEGTWKLTGTKLIVTLLINGKKVDVDYTCENTNDLLILTRSSPDNSVDIVNTFKKK